MTTAFTVLAGILLLLAYMGAILGLRHFARWSDDREEARRASEILPTNADVVLTDRDIFERVMVAQLDDIESGVLNALADLRTAPVTIEIKADVTAFTESMKRAQAAIRR